MNFKVPTSYGVSVNIQKSIKINSNNKKQPFIHFMQYYKFFCDYFAINKFNLVENFQGFITFVARDFFQSLHVGFLF